MTTAIDVIDAVIDEWGAAFDGPPEDQMDALNWIADQRSLCIRKPNRTLCMQLVALSAQPKERWAGALLTLWHSSNVRQ